MVDVSKRIMNVRDYSVDLENALAACQATGTGIKEKYLSIQDKLPTDIQQKIQHCNHLRNRIMHDKYDPTLDEYQQYEKDMREVLNFLHKLANPKKQNNDDEMMMVLGLILLALIGFLIYKFWVQILTFVAGIVVIGAIIYGIYHFLNDK